MGVLTLPETACHTQIPTSLKELKRILTLSKPAEDGVDMSFVTLPVDIDHGRVIPRGAEVLPEKGSGLLTLLPDEAVGAHGPGSVTKFVEKWAGAFEISDSQGNDERLKYLFRKHVK